MIRLLLLYVFVGFAVSIMQLSAESFRDRDIRRLLPKGWTRQQAILWFILGMMAIWPVVLWMNLDGPSKKG